MHTVFMLKHTELTFEWIEQFNQLKIFTVWFQYSRRRKHRKLNLKPEMNQNWKASRSGPRSALSETEVTGNEFIFRVQSKNHH